MPWLSPRDISNMHGACMWPFAAGRSPLCGPTGHALHVRAWGAGVVLMNDGVFGRQTKNETTAHLPLVSCAACRPRRTPASASAPARLTVADKFCNGWRGDTPFGHSAARGPRSGQFVPVTKIRSCMRMPYTTQRFRIVFSSIATSVILLLYWPCFLFLMSLAA